MRLKRWMKYQYYKMLRVKDTPSKVAQGAGLGFAMEFAIPIPFVSIFVAFVLARLLKMNSLAAVISSSAVKPFFPFFVSINLYVQTLVASLFPHLSRTNIPHPVGATYLEQIINSIVARGVPYLLAGLFNGIVVFIISYFILNYFLKRRIQRLKHRQIKQV